MWPASIQISEEGHHKDGQNVDGAEAVAEKPMDDSSCNASTAGVSNHCSVIYKRQQMYRRPEALCD